VVLRRASYGICAIASGGIAVLHDPATNIALNNLELRNQLLKLIGETPSSNQTQPHPQVDVVVTCTEVNHQHGTGILVQRIFEEDSEIFSLRGCNYYRGEQTFGSAQACLLVTNWSRADIFAAVLSTLKHCQPRRVICIPSRPEDVSLAIAVKHIFGIPLCTYIMDDPNVYVGTVPDPLMRELLTHSTLRLAISPEMRQAYEQKYDLKFWLLPPVVASDVIRIAPEPVPVRSQRGILVGNIWGQDWLDRLRQTIRGTGIAIDWYCNNQKSSWLNFDRAQLSLDGITLHPGLPEAELASVLRQSAFAILPSGTLDAKDGQTAIAALSLPSRIAFLIASSQIPIVVLGSEATASARFIERFQVGAVSPYQATAFKTVVERICTASVQRQLRQNAANLAPWFDCKDVSDWIWRSLDNNGTPIDDRYEQPGAGS
jgi:hypothetical protein